MKQLLSLPALPPVAAMLGESESLLVVLALHHLHHPDELDGVVKQNKDSRTTTNWTLP